MLAVLFATTLYIQALDGFCCQETHLGSPNTWQLSHILAAFFTIIFPIGFSYKQPPVHSLPKGFNCISLHVQGSLVITLQRLLRFKSLASNLLAFSPALATLLHAFLSLMMPALCPLYCPQVLNWLPSSLPRVSSSHRSPLAAPQHTLVQPHHVSIRTQLAPCTRKMLHFFQAAHLLLYISPCFVLSGLPIDGPLLQLPLALAHAPLHVRLPSSNSMGLNGWFLLL
ncbi:hypothetical protein L7F22_044776 [Adiantum nelumboides]|nr:hypothetical protein [Adiantum nelumboides]